eukprot:4934266-Pleurochrysis_carterae.AAC.1
MHARTQLSIFLIPFINARTRSHDCADRDYTLKGNSRMESLGVEGADGRARGNGASVECLPSIECRRQKCARA